MTTRRLKQVKFFAAFGLSFMLTYKGIQFISPLIGSPISLQLPHEENIPFVPFFIIFYLGAYIFIPYIFLSLKRSRDIVLSIKALLTLTLINYIFFLIMPVHYTLRPHEAALHGNIFAELTGLFYAFDPPNNNYPSLHVGYSVLMFHIARFFLPQLKNFSLICAILISMSTILVKQHYVLDMVAGIVLSSSISWIYFVRHWTDDETREKYYFQKKRWVSVPKAQS